MILFLLNCSATQWQWCYCARKALRIFQFFVVAAYGYSLAHSWIRSFSSRSFTFKRASHIQQIFYYTPCLLPFSLARTRFFPLLFRFRSYKYGCSFSTATYRLVSPACFVVSFEFTIQTSDLHIALCLYDSIFTSTEWDIWCVVCLKIAHYHSMNRFTHIGNTIYE